VNAQFHCPHCGVLLSKAGTPCPRCLLAAGLDVGPGPALGPGFLDDLPMIGKELVIADKYHVLGTIGRGGMGVVYRARQESLDRIVAVKMVSAGAHTGPEERKRFLVEAKSAARLKHPNIVAVFDWGEDEGLPFFTMEYVEGKNLAEVLKESGPPGSRRAAEIVAQMAEAMQYAHDQKILHRDLKPSNVLLDVRGQPKLTDFGLAKVLDAPGDITTSGQILGSLEYMAPEQASGSVDQLGIGTDVYGLGAVLYHLLAGRPPFSGATQAALLDQVRFQDPAPPRQRRPEVAKDLEIISLKCLEKEPRRRYASAAQLREDLICFLEDRPLKYARKAGLWDNLSKAVKRKPLPAGLSAALLLVTLLGGVIGHWLVSRAAAEKHHGQIVSWLKEADDAFQGDHAAHGMAALGRILRLEPNNRVAVERLINTLDQRSFLASAPPPAGFNPALAVDTQYTFRHALSANGRWLATATNGDLIRVWDRATGRLQQSIPEAHSAAIRSLEFGPSGEILVSASDDQTVKLWSIGSQAPIAEFSHASAVNHAALSPDGQALVSACDDGAACLWTWRHNETNQIRLPHGHMALESARFSGNGDLIVTGGSDRAVRIWEAATGKPAAEAREMMRPVMDAEFLSDHCTLRVVLSDGQSYFVTRTRDGTLSRLRKPERRPLPLAQSRPVASAAILSRLKLTNITASELDSELQLVAVAIEKEARVWSLATLREVGPPLRHADRVGRVRFSPEGKRLATLSADNRVRVWDLGTGAPLTDWLAGEGPLVDIQFSADGAVLIAPNIQEWHLWSSRVSPPSWLAELAEGLAGEPEQPGAVSPQEPFWKFRSELARNAATNEFSQWARMLLDCGEHKN
jgi:eukaryotic-like serine/threonine-protein kinase